MANDEAGCPGCSDHTFPRAIHLTESQVANPQRLLESAEVRPYRPKQRFATESPGDLETGANLSSGFSEQPGKGFIIHPLAWAASPSVQLETPALEGIPSHAEVPALSEEVPLQMERAAPPSIHFMKDAPSVEGDSVGNTPQLLAEDDCKCTDAELDTSFGIDGWQWQADKGDEVKGGTPLDDKGNKDKGKNRASYDVAGKNFPNDPGRFYFAAKVKITVEKTRPKAKIPIVLKGYAICGGVSSYGPKVGDVSDDVPVGRPCTYFFDPAKRPNGEAAWITWLRMVYQIDEDEARDRVRKLAKQAQPKSHDIEYFEWIEYVECKTGTYYIVVPIPPAPLGIDSSVNPPVITYSHVKHVCKLEACGKTLVDKDTLDRKLNVWDSSK